MVCLCSPLRTHADKRLADFAIHTVELLKSEKDILITKAISWVLRTMIKYHRKTVEIYIKENETTLPPFAIRETRVKLKTGRKSG